MHKITQYHKLHGGWLHGELPKPQKQSKKGGGVAYSGHYGAKAIVKVWEWQLLFGKVTKQSVGLQDATQTNSS